MINEEKQIEEIKQLARDIFEPREAIDGIDLAFAAVHGADRDDTHFMRIATHLYGKGYRKASEVAKEFFAEIEKIIEVDKFGEAKFNVRELYKIEKKYESEGGE